MDRSRGIHPIAKVLLNVGGGHHQKALPSFYNDWKQLLLDIQAHPHVDIAHDARQLTQLPSSEYDAVYCAHNLEHYYEYELREVLKGFKHLLKPSGYVHIIVPDIKAVMYHMFKHNLDLNSQIGHCELGPIRIIDVLYGHQAEIEKQNNGFYAHKVGFSPQNLKSTLKPHFKEVYIQVLSDQFEIQALAFIDAPTPEQVQELGLE